MNAVRKVKVMKTVTVKNGWETTQDFTGTFHGFYQSRDGEEAGPIALVEKDETGEVLEVWPTKLVFVKEAE